MYVFVECGVCGHSDYIDMIKFEGRCLRCHAPIEDVMPLTRT